MNGATAKDVQRARRHLHGGRRLARLARVVGALAILLGGLGAIARGLLWLAGQAEISVWPDRWQVTDILSDTMSVTITVFGVCVILYVVGKGVAADGELLNDLNLRIDAEGISWTVPRAGNARWSDIGHIVITANRPGRRRLRLLALGSQRPTPSNFLAKAFWDRAYGQHRYLLDVPIDRLTMTAHELFDEIRSHSGGRFPDVFDTTQFPRPTGASHA